MATSDLALTFLRPGPEAPSDRTGTGKARAVSSRVADARRFDDQRFIARTDEKLTAFVELESAIRPCGELS